VCEQFGGCYAVFALVNDNFPSAIEIEILFGEFEDRLATIGVIRLVDAKDFSIWIPNFGSTR